MKKWMKALIVPMVLVTVLVFARRAMNNEISEPASATTQHNESEKIVYRSTDGGESWQDISEGLPDNLRVSSLQGNSFFANKKGLYLRFENGLYHNAPNACLPSWTKLSLPDEPCIAAEKPWQFYWGVNLVTTNGTSVWSPVFGQSSEPRIRSVFETAGGAIFIGTDKGLFKTTNLGKDWKHVYAGGWAGHLAELDGVLVLTSGRDIIRSTDNGETWEPVTCEDPVTWDVKPIRDGFAALTSVSATGARRLSTSFDGGKTWQSVHSSLRDNDEVDAIRRNWNNRPCVNAYQVSIIKLGEDFLCMHRQGIFKSADKGQTWKLLLPAIDEKGFNLFVSGNVIYAVRSRGGC